MKSFFPVVLKPPRTIPRATENKKKLLRIFMTSPSSSTNAKVETEVHIWNFIEEFNTLVQYYLFIWKKVQCNHNSTSPRSCVSSYVVVFSVHDGNISPFWYHAIKNYAEYRVIKATDSHSLSFSALFWLECQNSAEIYVYGNMCRAHWSPSVYIMASYFILKVA